MIETAIKIAVISPRRERLDEIARHLDKGRHPGQILLVEDGVGLLISTAGQKAPEIMVIDNLFHGVDELGTLGQLHLHYPGVALILLSENMSSDFLIQAMRIGVRDVLPENFDPEALQAAVSRIEQGLAIVAEHQCKKATVIVFLACKGGSGATFLASNVGYALASAECKDVALIDLNLQFGDALLCISDKNPVTTLGDVARNIRRLDATFLASSLVRVLPNYGVLAAPEDPSEARDISPQHIDTLLDVVANQFDYVIIDAGHNLDAVTLKALDRAEMIFPVLQQTLPFIRHAKRLLTAFAALGYPREKVHMLLNRFEKGGDIHLEDIERTLGIKILKTIPNSFEHASTAVNQGLPIMEVARHDPISKSVLELAGMIVRELKPEKAGWFARLLHHEEQGA